MKKIRIDKSLFSAEDLEKYNELIAKASVEVYDEEYEDDMDDMDDEMDDQEDEMEKAKCKKAKCKKSVSPEFAAALERMNAIEKSMEMQKYAEIAKKYAPLGEKEDELAETLYNMAKSNQDNYNAYISILDKSLSMQEKSGIFAEIGKSARGAGTVGAEAKAHARAQEIMKADPTTDYVSAIAKAWSDPAIMAEYDAEYGA